MAEENQDQDQPPADDQTLEVTTSGSKHWLKKIFITFLLLILVATAAGTAWWWQAQQIKDLKQRITQLEEQKTNLEQSKTAAPQQQAANWPEYVSLAGNYRVKYKPDWLLRTCEGNEATVHLAPDEDSQAVCGSEQGSPILVASYKGDQRTDEKAISSYGEDISVAAVAIEGVNGKKIAYTHKGDEFVAKGTKEVTYEFFTGGRTYIAHYAQSSDDPDLLAGFEELVKTLKFSN